MNPDQNNPAPTDYTSSDYSVGSVTAPAGPQVVPPQQSQVNPNSTQNALQISEIRDGIVIMNDGSFRAVVMCHSINFDLMSPQEREAVEFSYQGFLNSLYFPVQIFIRSQKVDMRPYLEKIDKIRKEQDNMLLGLLMEDYIAFLADIAQQTNIMDKKFYLVIKFPDVEQDVRKALKQSAGFFTGMAELLSPGKPTHVVVDENTLENAKTELRNRVQAVMQGLAQCGIQSLPLDTEELIELYYDAYNPDTATRQEIKNFNDLIAPVVTKGEGQAPQPQLDKETP
jgi:type IV secretory pathway VirB4 component